MGFCKKKDLKRNKWLCLFKTRLLMGFEPKLLFFSTPYRCIPWNISWILIFLNTPKNKDRSLEYNTRIDCYDASRIFS
jgi:hypothetical protein